MKSAIVVGIVISIITTNKAYYLSPHYSFRCRLIQRKSKENEDAVEELLKQAQALREEAAMMEAQLPNRTNVIPEPSLGSLTLRRASMQNTTLRESVRRQVINAFDNIPPQECGTAFDIFWAQGPSRTVDKLIELSEEADAVESAYLTQKLSPEDAGDAIRVLRSRLRMWAKGFVQPAGDTFNLFDWLSNRTKT